MEIILCEQKAFIIPDQITAQAELLKAREKKISAFDAMSKVGSFLSHPKDEDFELLYCEHRYEPFWHIKARSNYTYDRDVSYLVKTTGPEVKSVSYFSKKYEPVKNNITLCVTEHCNQQEELESFVDAVTGKTRAELKNYFIFTPKQVSGKIQKMVDKNSILVPPQVRVSSIIRDMLSRMIKGIQADKILDETIEVLNADLYLHPFYAYSFQWKSKNKEAIIEIDALTGAIKSGTRVFKEYLGKVFDQDFLFDLGADTAGLIFPGGSIVVKAAKKYMDIRKDNK